jgi:2-pyrone-4,6-dicarboxylate lactonase
LIHLGVLCCGRARQRTKSKDDGASALAIVIGIYMNPSAESGQPPLSPPSTQNGAPLCEAPRPELIKPKIVLPADACDSHFHIFGPSSKYSYISDRVYTPPDSFLSDYLRLRNSLGLSRCVLVQPSVYGNDNSALLNGLRTLGNSARAVVVLSGRETDSELLEMNAAGVKGVRVNLVDVKVPGAGLPIDRLFRLQERIAPLGWHLELLVHVDQHPDLEETLDVLEVPIVFGHMGYLSRSASPDHPGMKAMLGLLRSGRAWAKLTGPYRIGAEGAPYETARTIARWLIENCPHRLVWGSDWPHVMVRGGMPHDADLLNEVAEWDPQRDHLQSIFVSNPASLYQWA